jgi:transmembrane sensor
MAAERLVMTRNTPPLPDPQSRPSNAVSEEAARWFALMLDGTATADDQADFHAWLGADPRHASAYEEMERLWAGTGEIPAVKAGMTAARAKVTRRRFAVLAGGAVLAAAAWTAHRQFGPDFQTGTGERQTVQLPDGSSVQLSTASAISFDFGPEQRNVLLRAGEAFFTVAPDRARPFVVEAAGGRVTALGTAFGVAINDQSVRVAVTRNAVQVAAGSSLVQVKSGLQVTYSSERIDTARPLDAEQELGWREGRLVFVSAPFARVLAALDRWHSGRIVLMDSALADRPVTLIVDVDRTQSMLTAIERALPVRCVNVTPFVTLVFSA